MTRRAHLSLLDGLFRDQYEIAADDMLEKYVAEIPLATNDLEAADNVARAHEFVVHELEPDEHGLPPRLYIHGVTSAALFWVPGIPTAAETEFGRVIFLAGLAWGAGTAIALYSLMRLHSSTGSVKSGTAATVTRWLQHHRATPPASPR